MFIVVGSGPAGISAAKCLLAKKVPVTMLDVGYTIEPEGASLIEKLRETHFEKWDQELLNSIHEKITPDVKGLPKKLFFGSDFPFRNPAEFLEINSNGPDILTSHARGGLSNVWGANMLPFLQNDLAAWPIKLEDLEPYYKRVFEFVDLSARRDNLEKLFPIHSEKAKPLDLSRQAKNILSSMERNRDLLEKDGIYFGTSRLALRSFAKPGDQGCIYCGHCLYGCPYGLIYSSAATLKELFADANFTYKAGCFVERLEENGNQVKVIWRNLSDGKSESLAGERAFIGAGTVATSRIILESMDAYDKDLLIRDSQYFLVPFFLYRGNADVTSERLQTLSQLAINFITPEISEKSVHVLVYTYNDLYLRAIKKMAGPLASLLAPLSQALLSRLVVMQGYLHSDDSPSIALRVSRPDNKGKRLISYNVDSNERSRPTIKKLMRRIFRHHRSIGGFPVRPLLHVGAAGKSYHIGASFPMRKAPGEFESDTLGRPARFSRVHLIDTSVFSDVPATNVTLTIMANAYRIADAVSG